MKREMRPVLVVVVGLLCALPAFADPAVAAGQDFTIHKPSPVSLDALTAQARARVNATPRARLAPAAAEIFRGVETLEPAGSGRVPNYLRVLAELPPSVKSLASLVRSVLYDGDIEPEVKMAMGLRMAQLNGSPYVAAHLRRFLNGTTRGRELLARVASDDLAHLTAADRLALRYAESLTTDIHGVTDEDFRAVRGYFNDGQVVELTLTVSFFNYFTRMVEALNLPVEAWARDTGYTAPARAFDRPAARVNLVSDRQLEWVASAVRPAAEGPPRASAGLANSQRAMMLSPEIASRWLAHFGSAGDRAVDRALKLHVSFAVSEANGCRYCTLHQVQGLRRLGVDMSKLMKMKKDDSALAPRELTAVEFARKLTRTPASMTDADYRKVVETFGEQGALEIVLQTCNFAFMNRFTDGLRLPSEDEAIKIYREVYGTDFKPR